jgi:uncharacterized protein (TIGR02118 family)
MMIKVIAPAQRHLTNRSSLAEFHRYWAESHGPLFANTRRLRAYVQHLTLPEAYGIDPMPTFDGVSMFWYDQLEDTRPETAADAALHEIVLKDDRQLFDRSDTWPRHRKSASVAAMEHIVLDGDPAPGMVKAIFIVAKLPGLTLTEFFDYWQHRHGPLVARIPGLRRYVQNHGLLEAYRRGTQTHDGWSELWFDDLASLHRAARSPQWAAATEDAAMLFAPDAGVGVAVERIQKDASWRYRDWGAATLSDQEILDRLRAGGYAQLADETTAKSIRRAAETRALAVWTDEHLVTLDDSGIDARPANV